MIIEVKHCRGCNSTGISGEHIVPDEKGVNTIRPRPCKPCNGTGHIVEVK